MDESKIVAVFGASGVSPGTDAYAAGVVCGRMLAERGFTVATGGYAGMMEAVSAGAASAGGRVIGVTAPSVFRGRHGANRHVGEEIQADTITQRIHELVDRADAAIALPGSIGTVTELLVAWNVAFVAQFGDTADYPVVAVGRVWRDLVSQLAATLDTDAGFVTCVDGVEAAVDAVEQQLTSQPPATGLRDGNGGTLHRQTPPAPTDQPGAWSRGSQQEDT
ncbi:MAG: LOG family protein [Acidimicrobiia bacterium]|nr:LOG family protein [Acidimicrobiia bacterium]